MSKRFRPILMVLLVLALSALLTACALRSLFGNVIIVPDIAEEVDAIITTVFSDSTAAVCLDSDFGFFECTYILNGDILTSTLYLLSEYGISGVLIDPVILQIPADVNDISAMYDTGGGPAPLVGKFTSNIRVDDSITMTAETGQQFLILELPASVASGLPSGNPDTAPEISYTLSFTRTQPINDPIGPMNIKIMLAGKATILGHDYYVPLIPCISDFASIPALEIPQSGTPVNLQPAIGNLLNMGPDVVCDHKGYYYNFVPAPPLKIYLPVTQR